MSTIQVELPDGLAAFVEEKVAQGGFADAADFIVALVKAASEDRTALEVALLEGLASGPAEPWTDAEWQDLRGRVAGKDSQT